MKEKERERIDDNREIEIMEPIEDFKKVVHGSGESAGMRKLGPFMKQPRGRHLKMLQKAFLGLLCCALFFSPLTALAQEETTSTQLTTVESTENVQTDTTNDSTQLEHDDTKLETDHTQLKGDMIDGFMAGQSPGFPTLRGDMGIMATTSTIDLSSFGWTATSGVGYTYALDSYNGVLTLTGVDGADTVTHYKLTGTAAVSGYGFKVVVPANVTTTIELDNVTYRAFGGGGTSNPDLSLGNNCNITLVLSGTNQLLQPNGNAAGIFVPASASLTVQAGTGAASLTTTGGGNSAGIGGTNASPASGSITINSGSITATGNTGGAGIGGAGGGSVGPIVINGGVVTAIGSINAAAIGGSTNGAVSSITINGGTVTGTGANDTAVIGGGSLSVVNAITINDGTIIVNANQRGAGIGCGANGTVDTITINGGTITANANTSSAGIGCGSGSDALVNNIMITGGTIISKNRTATGGGGTIGAGINIAGGTQGTAQNITITGGTVSATGGTTTIAAPAIGPVSGKLDISGVSTSVTATSNGTYPDILGTGDFSIDNNATLHMEANGIDPGMDRVATGAPGVPGTNGIGRCVIAGAGAVAQNIDGTYSLLTTINATKNSADPFPGTWKTDIARSGVEFTFTPVPPALDMIFDHWEATGATLTPAQETEDPLLFPMSTNDLTMEAVFRQVTEQTYTVNYLDAATNLPIATAKTSTASISATVTGKNEAIAISGYTYSYANPASIVIDLNAANNVLTLYYTKNPPPPVPPTPPTPPVPPNPPTPIPTPEPGPAPNPEPIPAADSELTPASEPTPVATSGPSENDSRTPKQKVLDELQAAGIPIFHIGSFEIPLYGNVPGIWALFNLLCMIAALILCVWGLGRKLLRRAKGTETDTFDQPDQDAVDGQKKAKFRAVLRWIGIVIGPIALVIFLLTEDMTNLMVIFDNWSILMAVLLATQIVLFVVSRFKKKRLESPEEK